MEIILILIGVVIVYMLFENVSKVLKSNKKYLYSLDELTNDILHVSINREETKNYDFSFEYNNIKYVFKVVKCPNNGEIVVNNKTIWQINLDMRLGKAPKNKIMVKDLDGFMNYNEENTKRYCLVYKDCYSIKQWVNECEMRFINSNKEVVYGIKFVKFNDFENLLKEIKDNK
jgi:hypothetical protein